MNSLLSLVLAFILLWGLARPGIAMESRETHQIVVPDVEPDLVGPVDGAPPPTRKALQDTIWIALWSGEGLVGCDDTGWTHVDGHVLNDGNLYWHLENGFSTTTGMSGNAAALGYHDDGCCFFPDGYDNDWYQGIRIEYTGAATLSFDYILDSENDFDFLVIETDSACASYERVDYDLAPWKVAADFRDIHGADGVSGLVPNGELNDLALPDYGPGTHCLYIAFSSDGAYAPCDSLQPTTFGEGLVVDNIVVSDASGTRVEDFEDGTLDLGTYVNMDDVEPFGTWARVYPHVTDNDACTENTTCAWLWTDHTTPTLANDPSMAFGPGGYVVRNWLDDILVSPWVSLASTPTAAGTILRFRRFPGNFFTTSRFVQSWSVRGRTEEGCARVWGHRFSHNSLGLFRWITLTADMTPHFDLASEAIQIRHRVVDRQFLVGSSPPIPLIPGPGPYVDDTRIGRVVLHGPVISEGGDSRSQAQDAFPTELHPSIPPSLGEHHRPTTDRFGTCAFSQGGILYPDSYFSNLVTGDSVWVQATDARDAGGVTRVQLHGAIVGGPHAGKAPPPYVVDASGFFAVDTDSVVNPVTGQIRPDYYFADLDDTYFRGGDRLLYFWMAEDAQGGTNSDPPGLTAPPASVAEAEAATGGLFEVSFLPTIAWSSDYLNRVSADPHGDLEPTVDELAASQQETCILYVNHIVARRPSGLGNRTTFMYTLDRLGYAGTYDVYDHQGMGSTNNHLGSRAKVEQARGYGLIVYDAGNRAPGTPILPDGLDFPDGLVDQAGWFRDWLAQAASSDPGFATLWLIGANVLEERAGDPLLSQDMGVQLQSMARTLNANPDVQGITSFVFQRLGSTASVDFAGDHFALSGGCPSLRDYDHLATSSATAVVTHVFVDPTTQQAADATIVMNRNEPESYNTIMQSHAWFDIRDAAGTPAAPERDLLASILGAVLPPSCNAGNPVDTGPLPEIEVPRQTTLLGNVPNPFNPTTTIHFDLARSGPVSLRIYDVAGRLVRQLLAAPRAAGRDVQIVWDGLDAQRRPVSSGVYLCRLEADGTRQTRKMLVLR